MPYKNKFTEKERWNKHGVNVKNFVLNQGSAIKFYFKVRRICRIWLVEFQTLYKPKIERKLQTHATSEGIIFHVE